MKKTLFLSVAMLLFAAINLTAQVGPAPGVKPAEFPGGPEGWKTYLEQNIKYPKKAYRKNVQGLVRIQFNVGKDGAVSDVTALTNVGSGLEEEAIRLIADGPNWIPAVKDGKKVIFRHIQSITFRLE